MRNSFIFSICLFFVFSLSAGSIQMREVSPEEPKKEEKKKDEPKKEEPKKEEPKKEEPKQQEQPAAEPQPQPQTQNEPQPQAAQPQIQTQSAEPQAVQPQPEVQPQPQAVEQQPGQPQAAVEQQQTQPQPVQPKAGETQPVEQVKETPKEETAKKEEKPEDPAPKAFIKGEISNIGSRDIIYPYNCVGVATGLTLIDQVYYLTIDPRFVWNNNKYNILMGLHFPLNIELFNTDIMSNSSNNFQLRKADFDEWTDYLRLIKYLQYGRSEDNFFISIGSNFSQTIGHGTIMKRYVPSFDNSTTKMSMKLNYYNDYFGFESVLGSITDGNMFGGLIFIKPLSFFLSDYRSKSFSLGYSFAADRISPKTLGYFPYADMPDPTDPNYDTINDTLYNGERTRRIQSQDGFPNRPKVLSTEFIYLQGIDAEFKIYKDDTSDIKTFIDYSFFSTDFSRGGATLGGLGRFNLDSKKRHAIRTQLELRLYDDSYLPSYFDTFYDVERTEMLTNVFGKSNFIPDGRGKYYHLMNDSSGKLAFSFYTEFSYSFLDMLSVSLGFEKLPKSFSIFGHLELPDLYIFRGMFDYYQRGIKSFYTMGKDSDTSSILRGVVRIDLWVIFLDFYAGKQWTFNPEYKVQANNLNGHYLSSWDFGADIEIGYRWGEKKGDKKDENKDK